MCQSLVNSRQVTKQSCLTISEHKTEQTQHAYLYNKINPYSTEHYYKNIYKYSVPATLHVGMTGFQDGGYTQLAQLQWDYLHWVKISFTHQ